MVSVDPVVRVASGATARLTVTLHNPTTEPCEFRVWVVGLDATWFAPTSVSEPVPPDGDVALELDLHAPAGTVAGRYPFLVAAQPVHTVTGEVLSPPEYADATVAVGDASRLLLAVEPAEPTGVSGKRFHVVLDNRTPEPITLKLSTTASRELYLRLRHTTVSVPPGEVTRVRAFANVHRRWIGPRRRIPFVVTAQGETTPVTTDAVFVARPLLSSGMTRVLAIIAVVSLWATVAFFALGQVSQHARNHSVTQLTVGAGGGAGSSGTGSGAAGAGGGGGGAGKSTTTVTSNGRINGVVTGADPSNVRVTLTPTSLVDETAEGAILTAATSQTSVGKLVNVAYEKPAKPRRTLSTVTAKDGSWAFAGVTNPGYYMLTFSKPGYQTVRRIITKDASAAQPLSIPLVAGSGHMSGTVTGPDGPVPGATVSLTDGTVTITTSTPTSGAVGTWSVSGLATPATYLVSAGGPGLASSSRLVSVTAGGAASHIDLTVQRGVESLVGHVTQIDETGVVDDAGGVTVTATDGKTVHTATTLTTAATTNGAAASPGLVGTFTLPNLPIGDYDVTFTKDGYAGRTQHVTLDGAKSALTIGAQLTSAGAVVTGTVLDGAKAGIPTAGITLTGDSGTYKSTTDGDGVFRLAGVAPGSYVLSAEKFGKVTGFAAVDAVAGKAPPPLTLTLADVPGGLLPATGHIRGRVVDARTGGIITCPTTVPAADCGVMVTTVDHRADGDHKFKLFAEPDTEYVLPPADQKSGQGLQSGLHRVTYSAPGYETASINVQVPVGGFAEAPQVALFPDAGISGTVTSGVPDSLPQGTCVIAVPFDGTTTPATPPCTPPSSGSVCPAPTGGSCTIVDALTGNYTVTGIPHGTYMVYVIPSVSEWIPVTPTPITVQQGETKRYDVTLNREGRIHLLVRVPAPNTVTSPPDPFHVVLTGPTGRTISVAPADLGDVLITGLQPGTYTAQAIDDADSSFNGTVSAIGVTTNQTAEASVVMVKEPAAAIGRLVYTVDNQTFGISGAKVDVTGVTSYVGTTPIQSKISVVTDSNGCFAVTPSGAVPSATGACTFAGDSAAPPGNTPAQPIEKATFRDSAVQYDIDATAQGFTNTLRVNETADGNVSTVELQPPPGRHFTGSLKIDGAAPPASVDLSKATVEITTGAHGSSLVVITPSSDGTLHWHDSNYTANDLVRPGTYEVRATMPGYDDGTATFNCPFDNSVSAPACDLQLSLGSHVGLTVNIWGDNAKTIGVGGAVVTLTGDKLAPITVTAPPGSHTVTFPDLSAGDQKLKYSLEVHAAGYQTGTRSNLTFTAGSGTSTQDVVLTKLGSITGHVYGSSAGQSFPLAGVNVVAHSGSQTFSTSTAADGSYTVTGTTEVDGLDTTKTWTVSAQLAGFNNGNAVNSSSVDFSADPNPATRDITLPADDVSVVLHVTDDAPSPQPVDGATVRLTAMSDNATYVGVGTGTPGEYALCPSATPTPPCTIPATAYSLQVSALNHAPLSTTASVQLGVASQSLSVTLASRLNAIAVHALGQAAGQSAADLAGATVTVQSLDSGGNPVATVGTGTTNSNGDYQLSSLDDGTYRVTVSKSGYDDAVRTVVLAAGQLAAIEATLQQQLGSVAVTVTSGGSALEGAQVSLIAKSATARSQPVQESDAAGQTTFTGVIPGDYVVTTTGPGAHLPGRSSVITVAAGPATPASVAIDEMAIPLELVPSDSATPTATVTISPSGGTGAIVTESVVADSAAHTIYVPGGSDYTITATAAGYDPASTTVTSGSTGTVQLDLTKSDTGAIDVTVQDNGSPAANAQVTISGIDQVFTTGPNATHVVVGGLAPAGNYKVSAVLTDGRSSTNTGVTVTTGTTTNVTVNVPAPTPDPTASIAVSVHTAGGAGVSASVSLSGVAQTYATDSSGNVTISGLALGKYTVFITPAGSTVVQSTTANLTVAGSTVAAAFTVPNAPVTLNVTLQAPNGPIDANLSGATVVVGNTSASATLLTDSSGKVTVTGLPAGTYTVNVTTVDGGTGSATTAALGAGTTTGITVNIGYTGTLVVHAQSSGSGNPAKPNVTITVSGISGSATTDSSGDATFPGVPAGTYTVTATPNGGSAQTASVTVKVGQLTTQTFTF